MEFKEGILIVVTHTTVEDMEGTMAEDKVQEDVMAEEMVGTAAEDMEDTEEGVEEVVVEGVEEAVEDVEEAPIDQYTALMVVSYY
jgi:hypothetical protein